MAIAVIAVIIGGLVLAVLAAVIVGGTAHPGVDRQAGAHRPADRAPHQRAPWSAQMGVRRDGRPAHAHFNGGTVDDTGLMPRIPADDAA